MWREESFLAHFLWIVSQTTLVIIIGFMIRASENRGTIVQQATLIDNQAAKLIIQIIIG